MVVHFEVSCQAKGVIARVMQSSGVDYANMSSSLWGSGKDSAYFL